MIGRVLLGLAAIAVVVLAVALTVDRRDDRAASPIAVMTLVYKGLQWDQAVARKWPEIDTSSTEAEVTGQQMQVGFGGSLVLAELAVKLGNVEQDPLRPLLARQRRLREAQAQVGRIRARQLGRARWWVTIWCDHAWQENQVRLLNSAYALTGQYGFRFARDLRGKERSLRALVQCRRALRFSITASDPAPARERNRKDWFVPIARANAELLRRLRALTPVTARQRRWHRATVRAAMADGRWLRFVKRLAHGQTTANERRREVAQWIPRDSAFTQETGDSPRPDR
jgi:hypothetical protein